ncbi:MAG: carbohydrate ABC transporter permease [Clostridium sp.]|uniref:carbohydrate ABC transporter permease n=1 Tax=Clostridium sp. TaxID=1506 RepID=UPI00290978C8|nr:carbohydrate ABC transporter permease [Clostridium sp.]MDU5110517.1 carbohydrate ABC transporter permease [Clostridium sp.]
MIISKRKSKIIGNTSYHIFMIILSLIMIYPFIWAVMSSFKPVEQLYSGNPLNIIPTEFTLQNYKRLMEVLPFDKMLFNSIFLSITIPIAMIIVAALAAYAVTRIEFKGRNILFFAFIATMMIPSHVTLIPNYKIIVDMNLYNSFTAIFLSSMFTASNAFNIFFFRQYFLSIPKDLENAAIVDGCSKIGIFFKIVLPNAKPAIATTAILSFRNVWNSFLWPMLVINDYDKLPLTVGLNYLKGSEPNWAVLLAGATLSIIPIVIIFLVFQKYFMASTMNSGFGGK